MMNAGSLPLSLGQKLGWFLFSMLLVSMLLIPAQPVSGQANEGSTAEGPTAEDTVKSTEDRSTKETVGPTDTAEYNKYSSSETPAYHLHRGSLARNRIVGLGRDVIIDGEAMSHVVALNSSAQIAGSVAGDVIVLGGEVALKATAKITGDVFVLGGSIDAAPGSQISGRSVAYPEASTAIVTLLEGPALGLPATSSIVIGAKLALIAFWAFLATLLFSIGGRELLSTSESVRIEPFRNFALGITGVFAMVLTALLFSAVSGALLGIPLLVLVMVTALVLRFWGMVAVFHALGHWICGLLKVDRPMPLTAATYGLLILGVLKFIPMIGIWTWTVATFIGVGASLDTKLGRREAWFQHLT